MKKFLKLINEAAPGGTLRAAGQQVGGSFLHKIGSTYNNIKQGSENIKAFGRGDLGQLANVGQKWLRQSLDTRTARIEQMGKMGSNIVYISDLGIIRNINRYNQDKHINPAEVTDGRIDDTEDDVEESFVADLTDIIKESNLLYTKQFIQVINENINTLNLSNAVFKLVKPKNYGEEGVLYQMIPIDKHLLAYFHNKGIKYITFLKFAFNPNYVNNTGTLYFYNLQNRPIPELTTKGVNFEYDGDRKMYKLGTNVAEDVDRKVTTGKRQLNRPRKDKGTGRSVTGKQKPRNQRF